MTVKQIAHRVGSLDACGVVLWRLRVYRLVGCLNARARRCRVYWLTRLGKDCQAMLRQQAGHSPLRPGFSSIGCWGLYGEACFRHRSAVIQPGESRANSDRNVIGARLVFLTIRPVTFQLIRVVSDRHPDCFDAESILE